MLTRIAALATAATLLCACSINVQDDRPRQDVASCAVACPGGQQASVSCAVDRVPQCACGPAPAATCGERPARP